ncbi:MAG: phosphoenolpyruvate carboxykinase (ATP), partial [Cardiobacterium sp.]
MAIQTPNFLDLSSYGIHKQAYRNLSPSALYKAALQAGDESVISSTGALIAFSGAKTGRSPKDKRIVKNPASENDIWWGKVNIPFPPESHAANRSRAVRFLNEAESVYVLDGYAGWDEKYRLKIRVITTRPYHALFMHNMLIRPTDAELAAFGEPDYVIYNAGHKPADRTVVGVTSTTSVSLSFEERDMVILGTEYAGEMKKGVF